MPLTVVILPTDDLKLAAVAYLAAAAFPEPKHGEEGGARATAEAVLILSDCERLLALGEAQSATALRRHAASFSVPRRGIDAKRQHILDRAYRSFVVLCLYRRRQHVALRQMTSRSTTVSAINDLVPSWTEVLGKYPNALKRRIALNTTGPGTGSRELAVKELKRSLLKPHSPALPLLQGLVQARGCPPALSRAAFGEWFLASLHEPSAWIERAVTAAQQFPHQPYFRGGETELHPDRLLRVEWEGLPKGGAGWVVPVTEIPAPRPPHLRRRPRTRNSASPGNAPVTGDRT